MLPAPEPALVALTQPIPGLPVAAPTGAPAIGVPLPSHARPVTSDGPAASPRGAGSIALSAVGFTFRLVNGILTIISGIAIAVIAHQHLGEDKAG